MIDLPHLATRLFNRPLLVQPDKLDTILAVVGPRVLTGGQIEAQAIGLERRDTRAERGTGRRLPMGGYMAGDGIAVLPILGTLVRRGSFLDSLSGLASYDAITEAATEIFADGQVRGVIAEMDTPGGEAGGAFDLARLFANLSRQTGKPFWAHANEQADSAGYAIASQAEEIWLATTAYVGSIGVVAAHVDMSGADEKAGLRWSYIYAGENKVAGNSHEPLSDGARAMVQEDIDDLYSLFTDLVSEGRGLDAAAIRDTKANSYRGERALTAGLADRVGTLDQAIEAFSKRLSSGETVQPSRASARKMRVGAMSGNNGQTEAQENTTSATAPVTTTTTATAPTAPAPGADAAALAAQAAQATNDMDAERKRCADLAGIQKQASALGVEFDLSAAITGKVTPDAARTRILEAAAERDAATAASPSTAPGAQGHSRNAEEATEKTKAAWGRSLKRR